MLNALILAGDRGEDGRSKALIKIGSRNMIEYVIESLRDSGCIDKVYIIGEELLRHELEGKADGFIKAGNGLLDNLKKGISELKDPEAACLVCTCDIPMVKGEAIRDFIERCQEGNIDLGYPVINKSLNDSKYPDVKRTYVRLKEGTFTGGNMIYINPQIVNKISEKIEKLVEYRKKPLKMGRTLGFMFLVKLALGRLSISAVERKAYETFEIRGKAIQTIYPEIGNDVDKPSDVEFVKRYLGVS